MRRIRVEAIRKDKTAIKGSDGVWYELDEEHRNEINRGDVVLVEDKKIIAIDKNSTQHIHTNSKDEKITRMNVLGHAINIVRIAIEERDKDITSADKTKTMKLDDIVKIVLETARELEEYINNG